MARQGVSSPESGTANPPGTGIIDGPEPKEPAPAPSRPPHGRRSPANRIEALRTEADMARRRYLAVDPSNRLVAATLEAEWSAHLEALTRAVAEREQLGKAHQKAISAEQDKRALEIAREFGRVWNAPTTSNLNRKLRFATGSGTRRSPSWKPGRRRCPSRQPRRGVRGRTEAPNAGSLGRKR